jgi:hypothetical protein
MIAWDITTTTIYCEAVADDVTLLIYKDRSARCTGYEEYHENLTKQKVALMRKKSKKLGRELKCQALECPRIRTYIKKVFPEGDESMVNIKTP